MHVMTTHIAALVLGTLLGLGCGWLLRRPDSRPFFKAIAAVLGGWVLGTLAAATLVIAWPVYSAREGGIGAASIGSDALLEPLAFLLFTVAAGVVTERTAGKPDGARRIGAYAVTLGGIGGLLGALWVVASITVSVG